ncbi:MAG: protein kinase [Planctomycetota bacterium]|nr:protein kinase [Planctomycetota bacterium]
MAKLVVRKGRNAGMEYKLNADRMICGRRSALPVPVLDPKASREHAVIHRRDGKFYLQDLSRNGTFVNEALANKEDSGTPLNFGDKIRIGETVMEVVDEKAEKIEIEIPGYKIQEKIGAGGMGNVYKAKQLSMDRVVALKVLNEKYGGNREFVERFIREARAAGKLNHPNVIHVHDVSKANGRHYFSMEFVDGNSVKELLRINRRLGLEQALDIVLQTGRALEFAHENGIVHRDIKPDNLMLTKDGVVKIADLGIAKSFDETGDASGSSQGNRVMGTPHYMAPEQALGKEIDHRVDIYSLGATFYHMLTGTTPFTGSTAHEVLKAHIQDSLAPIQELNKDVPDPICFIVERMMAKLPEKRYSNMTKLIQDLERAGQGIGEEIERIPAGDSTIMRAISDDDRKKLKDKKKVTEEFSTGVQTPVAGLLLYAGVAALFLAVVAIVVVLLRGGQNGSGENPAPPVPPDPQRTTPPDNPANGSGAVVENVNPAAQKLLDEIKQLLDADPVSKEAETRIKELTTNYPTVPQSEEAKKLQEAIDQRRREATVKAAQAALAAARKFEQEHASNTADMKAIADRFAEVSKAAGDVQSVRDEADRKFKEWEEKRKAFESANLQAALDMAVRDANAALAQKDYNTARRPLQEFIQAHNGTAQKTEAEKRLKELEDEAQQAFDKAREESERKRKETSRPLPQALEVWERYLDQIRDDSRKGEAEKARDELLAAAEKFAGTERGAVHDLALRYEYDSAMQRQARLSAQLGQTKWEEEEKGRDEQLKLQKQIHERFADLVGRAAQPVPLPFEVVFDKIENVKTWAVAGFGENALKLDPIPKTAAPGMTKKLSEFSPKQQYDIYRLFLKDPTSADHAALAAYCQERGLNQEAEEHKKSVKP